MDCKGAREKLGDLSGGRLLDSSRQERVVCWAGTAAVEAVKSGWIQGAFWREMQLIVFESEEPNTNSLKHKRSLWLM